MASNTYYSPFFPPIEGEGAKGTTVAAVPTTVVQDMQDDIQGVKDSVGDILVTPIFDGIAPPKVTGLVLATSITIGAQGESVVALIATWNKITTAQASDLARYDIQIKENSGNFVLFTTGVDKENSTTQSYQWSVRANQSFTVQVRGVDYPGNVGAWSDAQTLVSAKDTVPPAVPTSLNAETSLSSIFLRWLNPADLDLDRIQVYESTTNNSASAVLYATVNATAGAVGMYTRTGLPAGTTRWFFLKAVDLSGNVSGFSTGLQVVVPSLSETDFTPTASGITPVLIVTTLPTSGNYEGRTAMYQGKLYRYTSGAWTTAVAAVDISGQVTNTQIADLAINTAKFANGIEPVTNVTSVPSVKSTSTVFNTTDGKLYRWNGTAYVATTAATDISGTLDAAKLTDGTLDVAKFVAGQEPIKTVTSVPGTKSTNTLYNSTDGKLYRWNGSAYVATVPTVDLTGTVSSAQIATNAIDSTKLANGLEAVTVVTSVPGTKSTNTIYNSTDKKLYRWNGSAYIASVATSDLTGTVSNAQIATNAIDSTKLAAGLEAVTVVTSVPAVKSTSTIYNSTDSKLYRWNGSAYVASVVAADISGQLTDAQVAALSATKLTGTVVAAQIANGAIGTAKFATGLEPVTIVSSVPSTKSTTTIVNSTDGKLYRWNGSAYVASVPAVDIAGQLTDAQVAALSASKVTGTLSDAQLSAISAAKVTGQITGTQITDTAITTAKLAAGAVTTAKITAGAVTANEIASGSITTAKLTAGAITANEIAAGAITTAKLSAGAVTANEISSGAITTTKLAAGAVTANEIAANTITTAKIAAGAVTASEIAAGSIVASKLAIRGENLWPDAYVQDLAWWLGPTQGTFSSSGYLNPANPSNTTAAGWQFIPDAGILNIRVGGGKGYWHLWSGQSGTPGYTATGYAQVVPPSLYAKANTTYEIAFGCTNSANRNLVCVVQYFDSSGVIIGDGFAAATVLPGEAAIKRAKFTTPSNCVTVRVYWEAITASTAYSGFITVGNISLREAASGTMIVDGTITAGLIAAGAITTAKLAAGAVTANEILGGTITASKIAGNTITGNEIAANAITAFHITTNAITAGAISAGAIVAGKLAVDAVAATNIAAGAITSAKIAADAITSTHISANAITAGDIAADAVIAGTIAASAITSREISSGAITTNKLLVIPETIIADPYFKDTVWWTGGGIDAGGWYFEDTGNAAILKVPRCITLTASTTAGRKHCWATPVPFSTGGQQVFRFTAQGLNPTNDVVYAQIRFNNAANVTTAIELAFPANSGITNQTVQVQPPADTVNYQLLIYNNGGTATGANKYASISGVKLDVAATGDLIVAGAITADKIAANAITSTHISANAVTAGDIAANAVTSGTIAANAVTAGTISAGAVTAGKIATDAVTAGTIAAGAVTVDKLAANSITAGKLAVASRPVTTYGLNIRADIDGWLRWDAGIIQTRDSTGAYAAYNVTAGSAAWPGAAVYVWYTPGNSGLDYNTIAASTTLDNAVQIGTWESITSFVERSGVGTLVNGNKIITGSISANKIAADSITAGQIASGAITTAELASGAITTEKLAVGTGANMLIGAGIGANPNTFMRFDYNPDNVPFSRAANGNYYQAPTYGFCEFDAGQYSLPDSTTFAIRQSNSTAGSVGYCDSRIVWQRGPDGVQTDQYPVEVGKTYEVSVWSGAHRCKVGIFLEFRNGGNQTIGYSPSPAESFNNAESGGGNNLNAYKRIFARAAAPAGATWVCVILRKYNTATGADSWMFLNRPMLGVTSPNATELLSWSAPGHSVIQGDAILTGSLHANRISAGTISANELGAQSVTAAKIQSNSITALQIATDTITAANIAAGAIGASEVAAGAITASKVGIRGENLFPDPYVQDISWWKGTTQGSLQETGRVNPSNDGNTTTGGWQLIQDTGTLSTRVGGGKGSWQLWSGDGSTTGFTGTVLTQLIPPSLYAKSSTTYEVGFGCTNASNKTVTLAVQFFNSAGTYIDATYPIVFAAGDQSTIIKRAKFTTPANCVTVRTYWETNSGAAFSGFINIGNITLREAASGTMIVDGSITAAHIVAGSITSDRIQAGTITGDRLNTGTSLPGTITVGNTGVSIATVKDTADNANYNANNAVNAINIISSDGWLSKSEKPDMIRVWNEITNTVNYVGGSAANAGISTTNLYGARDYLATYLNSLSPSWSDANYDSPVNGAELRYRIQNAYNNIEDVKAYLSNVTFNYANDPANVVNNRGTTIDPGKILISGGTTLASWRGGGDNTQINGGAIAANTINANKLTIGLRGVTVNGLNFETNRVDTIYWGAGDINYYDDNNTLQSIGISGGAFTKVSNVWRVYVWWNRGQTFLNAGTDWYNNPNDILLAVYYGGTNMNVTLGRTIIDGDFIKTGSIQADRIQAGTIFTQQLYVGNNKVMIDGNNARIVISD